jgi:glycosyltransferase involved in cell wall biosynthesis
VTRVAIFTDNDFDKVNGVTTTLHAVLKHAPHDVAVRIYTASDFGSDSRNYFAVPSIGVGLPWYREVRIYWPRMMRFARALAADRIDVIHITTPGPVGLAARWLAARLNLPVTGSYHTLLGHYLEALSGSARLGRVMERYMRWVYQACDPILVPTEATASYLRRAGYPADRLRIWARGVDVHAFSPDHRQKKLRDRWHVDDRRPVVMYAGRLSREKGLGLMPLIQRRLMRERIAHRLVFVGGGPMAQELRDRCPDAEFLGQVPHADVATAMASADIFLFPSATDTLGNVVLEAQASGLPVVVSDEGGPRETMVSGQTGFIAHAGSVPEFGDHLVRLLRHPSLRRDMGHRAREHALTHNWPDSLVPLIGAWQAAARRNPRWAGDRAAKPVEARI